MNKNRLSLCSRCFGTLFFSGQRRAQERLFRLWKDSSFWALSWEMVAISILGSCTLLENATSRGSNKEATACNFLPFSLPCMASIFGALFCLHLSPTPPGLVLISSILLIILVVLTSSIIIVVIAPAFRLSMGHINYMPWMLHLRLRKMTWVNRQSWQEQSKKSAGTFSFYNLLLQLHTFRSARLSSAMYCQWLQHQYFNVI